MYTIWCERSALSASVLHCVLGHDDGWYLATNKPQTFPSVNAARRYFFSDVCGSEAVGSNIWIKGPRGGVYPMRRVA